MGKITSIFDYLKANNIFSYAELSHRSSVFAKIIQDAERDIREIL